MSGRPGTRTVRLLALLTLLAVTAADPRLAHAQDAQGTRVAPGGPDDPAVRAQAQQHFDEGVRLLRGGDWAGALHAFEASQALRPTPSVLFNIAGCQRSLGRYAESRRTYQRFLVIGSRRDQVTQATQAVAELAANVASLTVTANIAGAELLLDGRAIAAQPIDLDVGSEHVVEARRDGYQPARQTIHPAAAGPLTLGLTLEPSPAPPPADLRVHADPPDPLPPAPPVDGPVPPRRAASGGSALPWILAGTAVVLAGAAVGGYFLLSPEPVPSGDMNVDPR